MSENKMTHCPKCHKPLLNGAQFSGAAQFNLRCPWCQAIVTVTVQQQILTNLKTSDPGSVGGEMAEFYRTETSQAHSPAFGQEPISFQQSPSGQAQENSGFKVVGFLYPQKEPMEKKS